MPIPVSVTRGACLAVRDLGSGSDVTGSNHGGPGAIGGIAAGTLRVIPESCGPCGGGASDIPEPPSNRPVGELFTTRVRSRSVCSCPAGSTGGDGISEEAG
jgi:hypothetical protein